MKKQAKILMGLVVVAILAACVPQRQETVCMRSFMGRGYGQTSTPVVRAAPICQASCNSCPPTEYTVKKPVEVVYKNTTYRTIYVPQTTQSVSYEKRPYTAPALCTGSSCSYR